MKKNIFFLLSLLCMLVLFACGKQDTYEVEILIPAGSTEEYVFSDEEISPIGNSITISAGAGISDTAVVLKPIEVQEENAYEPAYLTQGMPVKMEVEKGVWFQIGVAMQNDSDKGPIAVSVKVDGVEVRIAERAEVTFEASVLEIHEGYYLVEPAAGSSELNSADRIEVPMKNLDPSLEPEVGDTIEISYNGEILETYPARINEVSHIKVTKEAEKWDQIPMVMVDGELYLDIGRESTVEGRCGVMDGEIISEVEGHEKPTEDDQSNFGTGYGYQYGPAEGTIEINMNGKWWVFATEEVRQQIQFPAEDAAETITYNGKEYLVSELSDPTMRWLELSDQERMLSSYYPPEFVEIDETWGITLTAEQVCATRMTICCKQSEGEPTGKLQTGSWYIVEQWTKENGWKEAAHAPQEYDIAWTQEAWMIPTDSEVKWEVDWEWLYGKLPKGKYRIGKEIMDFRGAGDYDKAVYFAEFEVAE